MSSAQVTRENETTSVTPSRGSQSPGPWRPSSLAGRSSPAFGQSSTFRDTPDNFGTTPPRGNALHGFSERQRAQPNSPSGQYNHGASAWTSPSKKPTFSNSGIAPPLTSFERINGNGNGSSNGNGSFTRSYSSTPTASSSYSSSSVALPVPIIVAESTPNSNISASIAPPQKQPLNMEDLAAKFADSKEKFAKLQLSPALSPIGLSDKDRRAPMGSFATSSSASPHFAHIKVQRTASLNQGSQNLLPKGSANRLQPGHPAQSTDMRRTASHNNAFSSGLGMPLSANNGGFDHNNLGPASNNHTSSASSGSYHPTPFSLSQLARPTFRSPLNTSDHTAGNQHEQFSHTVAQQSSSLNEKQNHPLQHTWTLYYDTATGFNRQGSSVHNYENNLRELGMFKTASSHATTLQLVELFARYFNWIEKPRNMENSSNYHLFKDGIKPMWEDPANANGGRWIVTLLNKNPDLLDRCWIELAYALVGEQLDAGDDICGAVLSRRTKADRLAVWVRDKDNIEAINGIGKRLIQMLDLTKEKISLEFQITTDSRSSGLPRNYITLDSIRKELLRDSPLVDKVSQNSEADTTPSLSVDSVSVTPVSVTSPSPITPYSTGPDIDKVKNSNSNVDSENRPTIGTSGLLISVEGSESVF
ncbi:hypothetical protein BGZ46_009069 [Entomortierella lignicola]|nr:hypothetical protein BGZ46_009069 [Entomortierella lignicola]